MINDDSVNAVQSAIANTEQALSVLDASAQDAAAHQEIVNALDGDVSALRAHAAGLDAKVRASRFTAANSALALAQSDLKLAQDTLSAQKIKTVTIGKAAARMLFDCCDSLQI